MKLLMISLGCDKNRVDSEEMLGLLAARGYELTDDEAEAEACVINTCCFIEDALKESIDEVIAAGKMKTEGKLKLLVVTGCMAQRYKEQILSEMPEVDAVVGVTRRAGIADILDDALRGKKTVAVADASRDEEIPGRRILSTGGHYAFLKIAEGCDKHCTYCVIPKIRGRYRSFPMEKLLAEAQSLAEEGVTELIVVAQETTIYGKDLYGEKKLHVLLRELAKIEALHWIRVLYCYPEEIYPELIDVLASEKKICHYLDLPIQSASDRVLKRMNRRTTEAELRKLVSLLRKRIPDIFLRTTLISGFPGETEEDFEKTLAFVREMKFDRLGCFTYSKEEGTPAAKMPDQLRKNVKVKRRKAIMAEQQKISLARGKARIGSVMEAVVEGYLPEEGIYTARTYGDAPGVDGYVFVNSERELMSGDFIRVRINGASHYDLTGEEVYESAE
ncbi:MAG: 30S ribosomal protein S12 methylthiotransferase RimO [Lachnospiraceae bacterium]|nr:30S ribosomal protein S12 methylthiotransferase RimO [Lachnospiraceae bacterium]